MRYAWGQTLFWFAAIVLLSVLIGKLVDSLLTSLGL